MKSTFKEAWDRFWADTPSFFNKIKIAGGSLAGVGTALATVPNVPVQIVSVSGYLITIGGVMLAVAQFAVKTPDDLSKK